VPVLRLFDLFLCVLSDSWRAETEEDDLTRAHPALTEVAITSAVFLSGK